MRNEKHDCIEVAGFIYIYKVILKRRFGWIQKDYYEYPKPQSLN